MLLALSAVGGLVVPSPSPVEAQQIDDSVRIEGVVLDVLSGMPLPSAEVTLRDHSIVTTTVSGEFVFVLAQLTALELSVLKYGYLPLDTVVSPPIGQPLVLRVQPDPISLPALTALSTSRQRRGAESQLELTEREVAPGAVAVRGAELLRVPSLAEPDIVRSLNTLPAVTARNALSAELHVQGGAPDQNAYLLDGARVFGPYHLFGVMGAFNPDAIGRVEVYRGALPVRFGGALSSVIDLQHRLPKGLTTEVVAGVGLVSGRVVGAGLVGDRGRFMIGARRSHADLVAKAFSSDDFPYEFHDAQGNFTFFPTHGHSISASFMTSRDRFRLFFQGGGQDVASNWRNDVGSVSWRMVSARGMNAYATVWGSRYGGALRTGDDATRHRTESRLSVWGSRIGIAWAGRSAGAQLGLEIEGVSSDLVGSEEPGGMFQGALRADFRRLVGHLGAEWWIGPLRLVPAVRVGERPLRSGATISPRLAARLHVGRDWAVTASAGRVHQFLSTLRDDRVPLPGAPLWFAHPRETPTSSSTNVAIGIDRSFGELDVDLNGHFRRLHNVLRFRPVSDRSVRQLAFDSGNSWGVDISARLHEGPVVVWASYSISKVFLSRQDTGNEYAAAWDRRHALDVFGSILALWGVEVSARMIYASGAPYWPFVGEVSVSRLSPLAGGVRRRHFTPVWGEEQGRLPDAFRVDLGLRRQTILAGLHLEPYVTMLNATRRANVLFYRLGTTGDRTSVLSPVTDLSLALSFSLGVDARF